jgi:hypothetical protein
MAKLWPSTDLDPVTFNSQYLQRCGSSGSAVLAAAQASVSLDAPIEEVESTLFQIFGEHVKLDVEVGQLLILSILLSDGFFRRLSSHTSSCNRSNHHAWTSSARVARRRFHLRRSSALRKTLHGCVSPRSSRQWRTETQKQLYERTILYRSASLVCST